MSTIRPASPGRCKRFRDEIERHPLFGHGDAGLDQASIAAARLDADLVVGRRPDVVNLEAATIVRRGAVAEPECPRFDLDGLTRDGGTVSGAKPAVDSSDDERLHWGSGCHRPTDGCHGRGGGCDRRRGCAGDAGEPARGQRLEGRPQGPIHHLVDGQREGERDQAGVDGRAIEDQPAPRAGVSASSMPGDPAPTS